MWSNCLRFVGDQPIALKELERLARTKTNLHGMQRWGHITVEPTPPKLIRATPRGLKAREALAPLFEVIEKRWEERFGKDAVDRLRETLWVLASRFDLDLPDCLPILGYGLFSAGPDRKRQAPVEHDLPLVALLSRTLLAFAMDFERESDLSLAICADVVRVLNQNGVRVRDLPQLSGVSKEAIAMAMGFLGKKRLAVVEPDPQGSRAKIARLTATGAEGQEGYLRRLATIEERWRARFGNAAIGALHEALEPFSGEPLWGGLEPYPDGWRASVRKPSVLPYYPMVLHRGGYPDGS
jgi:DNA-binding MarR family transcriptional regulator